ncbi:MAG: tetratricopeptide repeat protein, partial [Bradymonadaceae bacterium]
LARRATPDRVLEEVRERGLDTRVAMVTAVDPDLDILKLDFDEYVTKPLSEEDLQETVEQLLTRGASADGITPSELDRVRWYLVDIYSDLGEVDAAIEQVEALEERLDDESSRWRIRRKRAALLSRIGDHEAAEAIVGDLTAEIAPESHPRALAAAVELGAKNSYARGHQEVAETSARRALEVIEREGVDDDSRAAETRVDARNLLGRIALFRGEKDRAREHFETNRATAREWSWLREVTRAELNLAILDLQSGRFESTVEAIEGLLDRTPAPTPRRRAKLLVNLGMAHQKLGQSSEALEAYHGAFRAGRRTEDEVSTGIAAYNLATLCQDFGAYDRVLSLVEWMQQRGIEGASDRFVGTLPELLKANALLDRGDPEEALQSLEAAGEQSSPPDAFPAAKVQLRAVLAHIRLGDYEGARQRLERADCPEAIAEDRAVTGLRRLGRALVAEHDG